MTRSQVFVFGSNLAGLHGGGAAYYALTHCGAVMGEGIGRTGYSYAIPTMDGQLRPLPLNRIAPHIAVFLDYAVAHRDIAFVLTRIGCGIAGYDWDRDIAPLFLAELPVNVTLLDPL